MSMEIPLKQYSCNDCGKLSDVLDIDENIPNGWDMVNSHTHYCDKCKYNHQQEL